MKPSRGTPSFSLVEVMLALGIATFCLLSLIPLLGVGLKNSQQSRTMVDAAAAASLLLERLRATTNTSATASLFNIPAAGAVSSNAVPLYVDAGGQAAGRANGTNFSLSYRLERVNPASDTCRVYLCLGTPPLAAPDIQTRYEIATAIQLK